MTGQREELRQILAKWKDKRGQGAIEEIMRKSGLSRDSINRFLKAEPDTDATISLKTFELIEAACIELKIYPQPAVREAAPAYNKPQLSLAETMFQVNLADMAIAGADFDKPLAERLVSFEDQIHFFQKTLIPRLRELESLE